MWNWLKSLFKKATDPKLVAEIQAAVVNCCGFLPLASTVAGIVAAGAPGVVPVMAVANSICAAVKMAPKPMQTLEGTAPVNYGSVNGVPIEGVYVKRS